MKKILFITALLISLFVVRTQAQVTALFESFETGIPSGWTILDADNDGETWMHSSVNDPLYGSGYYGSGYVVSYSFYNDELTPDNWLISPAITLDMNSTLSFYRCVLYFYPEEHYGVYVSTTTTDPSEFTLVYEETCSQSEYGWMYRSVDLSDYDGNTVYIAFRHFNCTNMELLALDGISVTMSSASPIILATPSELHFGTVPLGSPTPAQQVAVECFNITGGVTASVTSPFEISEDNMTFATSVTLPDTGGTVYVRYFPLVEGIDNSELTLTGSSTMQTVALIGESVDCSTITLPYQQDFDSVPQNSIPNCWYQINPFDGFPQVNYSYAHNGLAMMFSCDDDSGEPVFAVMPQMPQDLSELQISFWTRREGAYSGTFSVGYVTNPSDSSTFVELWSRNATEMGDNNYYPFVIDFADVNTDPTTNYYIAFKYESSNNWFWYLDDVTVEEIPVCAAPTDLTVNTVSSSSANISWTGTANGYVVYYRPASDTVWVEIPNVTIDDAGYLLENLLPTTNYVWYVASDCGDGTYVNSMGQSTFKTECATYVAPFSEDFDAQNMIPDCWTKMVGLASDAFAGTAPTTTTSGWSMTTNLFNNFHPKINVWGTNVKGWLVTPPIDLSTLTNPALTFDLALTKYASSDPILDPLAQADDKFMVIVSTDNGTTWSAANATVWSDDTTSADYGFSQIATTGQEITISLAAYANETVKIAFYAESTQSGGDNDLHIDNVVVMEATSCTKPANLAVTAVTADAVTLSWTENGTANTWNIQYGPANFTLGSENAQIVPATTNPFTIENLTGGSNYDFYVQSNCGSDLSMWVGPVRATPGSFNMSASGTDTITTCSLIIYDNGGANNNYSSNCNSTLVIYPETEGSSIGVYGNYVTENNYDYLRIYDGVGVNGTMLGEFCGTGDIPTIVSSTGPMTIKFTSDNGIQYAGFTLNVGCVNCAPPAGLTVSNITHNSADVSWNANDEVNSWLFEYKAEDDTAWSQTTLSDTIVNLTDLNITTNYLVRVSSDCDGEYSLPAVATFTTTMAAEYIPYNTDFGEDSDQNWVLNNGSCVNHWTIGELGTEGALFITNNGTSAGYTLNGAFSIVSAEKLFTIGENAEIAISFDLKVGGESSWDYLKVFFAPADAEYPASNSNQSYAAYDYAVNAISFTTTESAYPYMINLTGENFVHVTVTVSNPNENPTQNSTAKLVFLWKNDSSDGTQPGAIIRNLSIAPVSCSMPSNLTVNNITTNSAEVTWTATGSETAWNLEYKTAADTSWTSVQVTTTPTFTLSNLSVGTEYQVQVQADCGDNQSIWTMASFSTFCDAVTTYPYTEDFEHGGSMASCWTQSFVNGTASWTAHSGNYSSISSAHSGSYNAYFFNGSQSNFTTKLISPMFDLSGVTDPYLSYWFSQAAWSNDQDILTVYYRTSPSSEWQELSNHVSSVTDWTLDSVMLPNPTATYQIAFQGRANYGYGITVDDITIASAIADTEPCDVPESLEFSESGITQTSAVAVWVLDHSVPSWLLQYKAVSDDNWTEVTTDHPWYTINGLTPNTTYQARVRANCSDGGVSEWTEIVTFTTLPEDTPIPCEAPTGLTSTNVENHAISIAWDANADVNSWNIRYRIANSDWTIQTSNTNSYTITGLEGSTIYVIQVQADCGNDGLSEWSSSITVQTTNVGIENRLANSVTLYPNPANDVVNVECTMNNVQLKGIEVIDVYGKVVRVVETLRATSLPTRINVSGLANGMYFVRVTTEEGVVTKPFVVKR